MSDLRVPPDSLRHLVGSVRQKVEAVAGSKAAQQAGQILSELSATIFESQAGQGRVADRLPSVIEQLGLRLKALGIDAATVGEVLNQLATLVASGRQLRPDRTLRQALRDDPQLREALSGEQQEALSRAIDDQAEAADLLASLDAQQAALKGRYGKY